VLLCLLLLCAATGLAVTTMAGTVSAIGAEAGAEASPGETHWQRCTTCCACMQSSRCLMLDFEKITSSCAPLLFSIAACLHDCACACNAASTQLIT
jgi:hypothetical protein